MTEKFNLLDGMEDGVVLEKIESVINKIAYKYVFGSYTLEDIKQEARILALDGLKRYDGKRPLENFLYIHLKNRLFNFKRDNYIRLTTCKYCTDKTCSRCERRTKNNLAKQNLAYSIEFNHSKTDTSYDLSEMELAECKDLIDRTMPLEYRADYIRMINGVPVNKERKQIITKFITELFYG
jgi:DNA-directed RNA polymerase specialized sigma24 family protein